MKRLVRNILLLAGLGSVGAPLAAQYDESAIRQTDQISVVQYRALQYYYYTVTVRTWDDLIIESSPAGYSCYSASQLRNSAYQVVTHSSGNISLRFCRLGNPLANGGTITLKSRGVVIDSDRLRCL